MTKRKNRGSSSPQSGNSGGGYPRASLELSEDQDFSQQAVNRKKMLEEIVEVVAKKEKEREAKKERVLAEFSQAILSREDQMKQEKAAKIKAEQDAKAKQQVSGIIDKMTDTLSNEVGQLSKNFISRGFFAYEIRTKRAKLAVLSTLKKVLDELPAAGHEQVNFAEKWKAACETTTPPITVETVKRAFRSMKSSRTKAILLAVEKTFNVDLVASLKPSQASSSTPR